jgi:hypothetical protein
MVKEILAYLRTNPGAKAKAIASYFGKDRAEINRVLHGNADKFQKDSDFAWSVVDPDVLTITLPGDSWITSHDLESTLQRTDSPLDSNCSCVKFVVQEDCKLMLDALARLLALCNQLAATHRTVVLDFSASKRTLSYLNRVGFLSQLSEAVEVLPRRPKADLATAFRGHNDGVVELRSIDPNTQDIHLPKLLRNSFVSSANASYSDAAFTVLAELLDNVYEHSKTQTEGFAGLQFYRGSKRIQTVISDSGLGIVSTLGPNLTTRYPAVARRVEESGLHTGVALLKEVFSVGGLSQFDDEGRGGGLKKSGEYAKKYKATISVRQKDFELRVHHGATRRTFSNSIDLVRIEGTHICFDFQLD